MKNLLIAAILMAGLSAQAQDSTSTKPMKSPEEKAAHQSKKFTKRQGLSADQATSVNSIFLAYDQHVQSLQGAAKGKQRRQQMMGYRSDMEQQMKGVLTADQFQRFLELEKEQKQNERNKRLNQGAAPQQSAA